MNKYYTFLLLLVTMPIVCMEEQRSVPRLTDLAAAACNDDILPNKDSNEYPEEILKPLLWKHTEAKTFFELENARTTPIRTALNLKELIKHPVLTTQDGNYMMVLENDGIQLFDIQNVNELIECAKLNHPKLTEACMTHDGKQLISWSNKTDRIVLWNIQNKQSPTINHTVEHPSIEDVQITRDDRFMATIGDDTIALWSIQNSNNPIQHATIEHQHVLSIRFTDDYRYLLSQGYFQESFTIWDLQKFQEPAKLTTVPALKFPYIKGNRMITSKQEDNAVTIRTIDNPDIPITLPHKDVSTFYVTDSHILSAGNSSIKIWNIQTDQPILNSTVEHADVHSVLTTQNHQTMVSTGTDAVILWNIQDPANPVKYATIEQENASKSLFSPNERYLIIRSYKPGIITIWNVANPCNPSHCTTLHHQNTDSLIITEHNPRIISTSWGINSINLWNITLDSLNELTFNQRLLFIAAYNNYKAGRKKLDIRTDETLLHAHTELPKQLKSLIKPYVQTENLITSVGNMLYNVLTRGEK